MVNEEVDPVEISLDHHGEAVGHQEHMRSVIEETAFAILAAAPADDEEHETVIKIPYDGRSYIERISDVAIEQSETGDYRAHARHGFRDHAGEIAAGAVVVGAGVLLAIARSAAKRKRKG